MLKFSNQLLQAVAQLELQAKRNVTALLAGNYRTAFRGSGMQFKEFRHYEAGDDIRHMSWPVTARTGKATVKTYEEERELNVVLAVDVSGSSLFGSGRKRKIDMYAELVALIGLAAVKSGDNVGMLLFNEKPVYYLPPRRTREQVMAAVSHILGQPLEGAQSNVASAFRYLLSVLKHRALVIVLSDFWTPSFENEMVKLCRKHELVLLHGYDDSERGSFNQSVMEVWDPERDQFSLLDTGSKRVRRRLAERHTQLTNQLTDLCTKSNADYLTLSVEDDYLQRLVHFFRRRGPSRV